MIELVFIACLSAAPDVCRTQSISQREGITARVCLRRAQPQLARWVVSHPKWRIARWKCQPASQREIDI